MNTLLTQIQVLHDLKNYELKNHLYFDGMGKIHLKNHILHVIKSALWEIG